MHAIPPEDVIDLATGTPPSLCLSERYAELRLAREELRDVFSYTAPAGSRELRALFAKEYTVHAKSAEGVLLTHGTLGAIDMIVSTLLPERPIVFAANPSYRDALSIFRHFGLEVQPLPWANAEELDLDPLLRSARSGRPTLVYVVPTLNNPDGATLSSTSCSMLLEICLQYDLVCIEDDAYGSLLFDLGARRTVLRAGNLGNNHRIVRVFSLSKVLMPGLRMAFVEGSEKYVGYLGLRKRDYGLSPVLSLVAQRLLSDRVGVVETEANIRQLLKRNAATLVSALNAVGLEASLPRGGYFLWVNTRTEIDTRELVNIAREHGVAFAPGEPFWIDQRRGFMRLSFARANSYEFETGAARLVNAIQSWGSC